jgi:hypothetical protein
MLLPRTLARSIAAEVLIFAGIGFLAFIAVLLIQNLAQSSTELVASGCRRDASAVCIHLWAWCHRYAVPVGFLFECSPRWAALGRLRK